MSFFTFLKIPYYTLIYLSSFFIHRKEKVWGFLSCHKGAKEDSFANNCKYFFLHVSQKKKDVKPVWLTNDIKIQKALSSRGYNVRNINSPKGIYDFLRSKYIFVDGLLSKEYFPFVRNAKIIQLWHTRGLKKLKLEKGGCFSPHYSFFISSSSFVSDNLLDGFELPKEKIIITGYPRNDVFSKQIKDSDIETSRKLKERIEELKREGIKSFILYMPTFRRGDLSFNLERIINVQKLNSLMREQKAHFFIKLHPKFGEKDFKDENSFISFIEESDFHPLLKEFSILITDYSSIFVDFLLTGKPIIFFPYDLQEYRQKEGFALEYEKYTPGPKVFDSEGLLQSIKEILQGKDAFQEKRKEIKNLYHRYEDGNSSERIINAILRN